MIHALGSAESELYTHGSLSLFARVCAGADATLDSLWTLCLFRVLPCFALLDNTFGRGLDSLLPRSQPLTEAAVKPCTHGPGTERPGRRASFIRRMCKI